MPLPHVTAQPHTDVPAWIESWSTRKRADRKSAEARDATQRAAAREAGAS